MAQRLQFSSMEAMTQCWLDAPAMQKNPHCSLCQEFISSNGYQFNFHLTGVKSDGN